MNRFNFYPFVFGLIWVNSKIIPIYLNLLVISIHYYLVNRRFCDKTNKQKILNQYLTTKDIIWFFDKSLFSFIFAQFLKFGYGIEL